MRTLMPVLRVQMNQLRGGNIGWSGKRGTGSPPRNNGNKVSGMRLLQAHAWHGHRHRRGRLPKGGEDNVHWE